MIDARIASHSGRINLLRQAEAALTRAVVDNAGRPTEEEFFHAIQEPLDAMCEAIARAVDADSCAFFLVTEDASTEAGTCIIMRAASGNFKQISSQGREQKQVSGYTYPSRLNGIKGKTSESQHSIIRGWPVTNQIWHLGDGRLANSNRAMNVLAESHEKRMGEGDVTNYPNTGTLRSVFRNMVAIPIFARGGATPVLAVSEEQLRLSLPSQDRAEFLSRYRVIGIFKVENKKPQRHRDALPDQQSLINHCPTNSRLRLTRWLSKEGGMAALRELFDQKLEDVNQEGFNLINLVPASASTGSIEHMKQSGAHPDSDLIDYLSEAFDAQFTQEDAELLVSLAMQLGRILARRTIEYAARQNIQSTPYNIVISEHEVGTLNIRHRDIDQLASLFHACDSLRREVENHFKTLKLELEQERQREIYQAQVSHRIEPRGPIRQVSSRIKHPISLFRKLVNKQEEIERRPVSRRLIVHQTPFDLHNFHTLSEPQAIMRGYERFFFTIPPHGGAQAQVQAELGIKGGPQAVVNQRNGFDSHNGSTLHASIEERARVTDFSQPLARRILEHYRLDDIGGVRVICDYLSDLGQVLEHVIARAPGWDIGIARIDEAAEVAKEGGYRGIHVTLKADVRSLLPAVDAKNLEVALGLTGDEAIEVPCEVQLHTTLQESEALKSHDLTYKREADVDKSLLELLHILSNQLHETDKTSDLIRDRVEAVLLPEDFGERELLNYLRPRLSHDGFTLVALGLECAKRIHQSDLRMSGLPYMSNILATCARLVYNFDVTDPEMLFLSFLHDLWMNPCAKMKERLLQDDLLQKHESARYGPHDFTKDLRDEIHFGTHSGGEDVLRRFGARLNWDEKLGKFPPWFWVLLGSFRQFWHDYHQERYEDLGERLRERLQNLRSELEKSCELKGQGTALKDWLQRAFVLEAAILLGQLEDLPDEPNRTRAEERFRNAYEELEIIASNLPPSPIKLKVIEETTKVFRQTAERLDVEVPINWYR
jgi:ppGpp synthetase/RelA/SpoT-type nucleotidyltranferase